MARSGDLTRSTSVQCGLNSKIPLECVLCVLCVFEMSQIWLACVPLAIRHFKKIIRSWFKFVFDVCHNCHI